MRRLLHRQPLVIEGALDDRRVYGSALLVNLRAGPWPRSYAIGVTLPNWRHLLRPFCSHPKMRRSQHDMEAAALGYTKACARCLYYPEPPPRPVDWAPDPEWWVHR